MHVEPPGGLVAWLELPGLLVRLPDVNPLKVLPQHIVDVVSGEVVNAEMLSGERCQDGYMYRDRTGVECLVKVDY